MAIGTYQQIVTLDETDGAGGVRPLDPPTWYGAPIAEGGGLVTLVGHYHAGITTATRVHFKGRTFHVDGVLDRGGRGFQTQITCQEVFDAGAPTVPVGPAYHDLVIADGASHYWRLDDTGAVALDIIGGATGTISGGVTRGAPGAIRDGNAAMTFDGTTGKIVTAAHVALPPTFTLEAWITVRASAPNEELPYVMWAFPTAEWFNFKLYPGRLAGVQTSFSYSPLASALTVDLWHHLVWVFENTVAAKCFVDGGAVAVNDGGPGASRTGSTGPFEMGYSSGHSTYWPGSLDDVAIYPTALTPAQILAHYTAGTT